MQLYRRQPVLFGPRFAKIVTGFSFFFSSALTPTMSWRSSGNSNTELVENMKGNITTYFVHERYFEQVLCLTEESLSNF